MTLAMATLCFCPPEMWDPLTPTFFSKPVPSFFLLDSPSSSSESSPDFFFFFFFFFFSGEGSTASIASFSGLKLD